MSLRRKNPVYPLAGAAAVLAVLLLAGALLLAFGDRWIGTEPSTTAPEAPQTPPARVLPAADPTETVTEEPAEAPVSPTEAPTKAPTEVTEAPTEVPTEVTEAPTEVTEAPTETPTAPPTEPPTEPPTTPPTEPVTEPETEAPTEAQDESTVPERTPPTLPEDTSGAAHYVLNTNTKKFHTPGCSSVKTIKDENRAEVFVSRDTLLADGYEPCKRCNP